MRRRFAAIFCVLALVFFAAIPGVAADGQAVYAKSCKTCHGADGKGNAKLAEKLGSTADRVDMLKAETQKKSDIELQKLVKNGTGKMKGKGAQLKDDEIAAAVAHLRTLAKGK